MVLLDKRSVALENDERDRYLQDENNLNSGMVDCFMSFRPGLVSLSGIKKKKKKHVSLFPGLLVGNLLTCEHPGTDHTVW